MFNAPNVMFSIALVTQASFSNILFGSVAVFILFAQTYHVTRYGADYFGFKEIFDLSEKGHFKKFICIFFLSRIGATFSLAFVTSDPIKGLIGSAVFEAVFILTVVFTKPFIALFNNIFVMLAELFSIGFFASTYASVSL